MLLLLQSLLLLLLSPLQSWMRPFSAAAAPLQPLLTVGGVLVVFFVGLKIYALPEKIWQWVVKPTLFFFFYSFALKHLKG